jgi:hypothetical protein
MGKYFFDVHCHAINMSHPNFLAFLKRFEYPIFQDAEKFLKKNRFKTLLGVNYLLFNFLFFKKLNKSNLMALLKKAGLGDVATYPMNLLAAMENDAASLFILMEECLLNHVMKNGKMVKRNMGWYQWIKNVKNYWIPNALKRSCCSTFKEGQVRLLLDKKQKYVIQIHLRI